MKTLINFFAFLLIIGLSACDKVIEERLYTANVPIYMSYEELRAADAVESSSAQALENPGKIYVYNDYLLINESRKGIHVIDNSNPSSPQKISFIMIPGNVDISVKSNILYADSYTDLLAIDISDPSQIILTSRTHDAFTQAYYPAPDPRYPIAKLDPEKGVVIGWKVEEVEEVVEGDLTQLPENSFFNTGLRSGSQDAAFNSGSSQGVGGSMARFIVYEDYLYTLETNLLGVYQITEPTSPQKSSEISLNRISETLFTYEDKLFIGTTTGMLIYTLQNPNNPVYTSNFNHSESCDPVVVENGYAYITLRSGSRCGGWSNQLDVVDVNNLNSPFLVKSYPMTNPMGLGISDNTLFICDGEDGLKIYNASDKNNITNNLLAHFSGIVAYDVIPINGLLMLTGEQGIYQYDYSDVYNIKLLSVIPVE